jgi:hypothetical protein
MLKWSAFKARHKRVTFTNWSKLIDCRAAQLFFAPISTTTAKRAFNKSCKRAKEKASFIYELYLLLAQTDNHRASEAFDVALLKTTWTGILITTLLNKCASLKSQKIIQFIYVCQVQAKIITKRNGIALNAIGFIFGSA